MAAGKKKEYSDATLTMVSIYRILAERSSKENPMSIGDIHKALTEAYDDEFKVPSKATISRMLPAKAGAMNVLYPNNAVLATEKDKTPQPGIVQTYSDRGTLHIVVEDRSGKVFSSGDVVPVIAPLAGSPASPSSIDKLLQKINDHQLDGEIELPFTLKCVCKINKDGKTSYIPYEDWEDSLTDDKNNKPRLYYLEGVLSGAEWRMLFDLVQVYPYISNAQTKRFLEMLKKLAPEGLQPTTSRYAFKRGSEKQFSHLAKIDKAIKTKKQVVVTYGEYKLKRERGENRPVLQKREKNGDLIIAPYALMWSNGYYYLVGREKIKGGLMNLRADRIIDVKLTEESFKKDPVFDPYEYRDRSPVMYPGDPQVIKFRCDEGFVNTVLDFFGPQAGYSTPADGFTDVTINLAPGGVKLFALQYINRVEILEPASLREDIKQELEKALKEKYR